MSDGVWRHPAEESINLYPGLVVSDNRVSGSITIGQSRLPLWAFVSWLPEGGWEPVVQAWDDIETEYGWTAEKMGGFLNDLMELRGEFARLLLVLADAERLDTSHRHWWETKRHRKRVGDQLRRCLTALEGER